MAARICAVVGRTVKVGYHGEGDRVGRVGLRGLLGLVDADRHGENPRFWYSGKARVISRISKLQ